ncbi:MAG: hypothetical protein FWH03_05125 [Firmicutes bacterium]|nr:hypothetical protein [Bacillota bacterium]
MSRIIYGRSQVSTEKERYGHYITIPDSDAERMKHGTDEMRPASPDRGVFDRAFNSPSDVYAPRGQYIGESARTAKKRPHEDVMPTIKEKPAKRETARVNAPAATAKLFNKWTVIAYLAAVVVLAAVVIGTSIAISNATARLDALEAEQALRMQTLSRQASEISALSDPAYIRGLAVELDMEIADGATEIPRIGFSAPAAIEPQTNPFDRFSRWLSGSSG